MQMVLPMAEMVGWLRKGVGELIRQAGLQLMDLLMQEEVRELVGERSQPKPDRTANRWGSERGFCVVMGQKVPIRRPRVRTTEDKEVRLGSYEMFHRGEPLTGTVWEKLSVAYQSRTLEIMQGIHDTPAAQTKNEFAGPLLSADRLVLEVGVEPTCPVKGAGF